MSLRCGRLERLNHRHGSDLPGKAALTDSNLLLAQAELQALELAVGALVQVTVGGDAVIPHDVDAMLEKLPFFDFDASTDTEES